MPEPEVQTPETPPTPAPPQQAAIPVADLSGALVDAWQKINASQPRPQAQDPFDAMTDQEKQDLANQAITDPIGAFRKAQAMGSRATEQRMMQAALPLIQSNANTIVELYKTKKQRNDAYFARIEPLFDQLMVGVDITPLVSMNEATRTRELDMRWKMARADVLEVEMKKVKPDPLPMGSGSGGGNTPSLEDDTWMSNMAREYGFTPEQMKELEALG